MNRIRLIPIALLLLILCNQLFLFIHRDHTERTLTNSNTVRPISENRSVLDKMTKICMMVPAVSRGIKGNGKTDATINDLHLISVFLPSLLNTTEPNYDYTVYVGYDYGDEWYDNEIHWLEIMNHFQKSLNNYTYLNVRIKRVILYGIDRRITAIWNTIANVAYHDGCDYYYPANDDILLITYGWTTAAIKLLQSCIIKPNFGIVAFHDVGLCDIPTFHLVHRTHIELHDGVYYPLPSHGSWQDPWIFSQYIPWNCSFFLPKYALRNHVNVKGDRYDHGSEPDLVGWLLRSRTELYRKLQNLSSIYDQSRITFATLSQNVDRSWKLPCDPGKDG